jgi:hypothetical protein
MSVNRHMNEGNQLSPVEVGTGKEARALMRARQPAFHVIASVYGYIIR